MNVVNPAQDVSVQPRMYPNRSVRVGVGLYVWESELAPNGCRGGSLYVLMGDSKNEPKRHIINRKSYSIAESNMN